MDLSAIINSIRDAVKEAPIEASPSAEDKNIFLEKLSNEFAKNLRRIQFRTTEYSLSENLADSIDKYHDKCDLFVKTERYIVIVELDATRADQVAKKMLSRYYYADKYPKPVVYVCLLYPKPVVYVCLLYPGTEKMNPNECIKYMTMGKDVLLSMNPANRFIGAFIKGDTHELKLIG